MRRTFSLALVAALLATGAPAQDLGSGRGSAAIAPSQAVTAHHGMVVAQEARAARIGAQILRAGGNAVDAAIATGFVLAVTYPRAGNIGGGGFMVIHLAKGKRNIAIDYREMAPAATTRDIFLDEKGDPDARKSRASGLAIGVPGTVAGFALAHRKYGSGKFTLRATHCACHRACARRLCDRWRPRRFIAGRAVRCSRAGPPPQRFS